MRYHESCYRCGFNAINILMVMSMNFMCFEHQYGKTSGCALSIKISELYHFQEPSILKCDKNEPNLRKYFLYVA